MKTDTYNFFVRDMTTMRAQLGNVPKSEFKRRLDEVIKAEIDEKIKQKSREIAESMVEGCNDYFDTL